MRTLKATIAVLFLFQVSAIAAKKDLTIRIDEEFYSTKKKIRIRDGIGAGRTEAVAYRNAILDARKKALVRVTSTFRHVLSSSKNGEFVDKAVWQDVHAKIIDKEKCFRVNYDHNMKFSKKVAVVDCEVTVQFLDLDFFTTEVMKTAEAACVRSLFISGWGQIFNKAYFHGISLGLITYGSIGYGYYRQRKINQARQLYENANNGLEAERRLKELQNHRMVARTLYISGAITWAYSVWEAFEDRERTDEVLDIVHKKFFPKFRFTRKYSPIQHFIMDSMRPGW